MSMLTNTSIVSPRSLTPLPIAGAFQRAAINQMMGIGKRDRGLVYRLLAAREGVRQSEVLASVQKGGTYERDPLCNPRSIGSVCRS